MLFSLPVGNKLPINLQNSTVLFFLVSIVRELITVKENSITGAMYTLYTPAVLRRTLFMQQKINVNLFYVTAQYLL
jgi:hypothetical protein